MFLRTAHRWCLLVIAGIAWPVHADAPQPAPLIVPDAAALRLDQVGLYTVGYQYRGQATNYFSTGWSGGFEAQTGVALQPAGGPDGKPAVLLHPPWRGGTGVAFQEFRIQLPPASRVQSITLAGATALRGDAIAKPGEAPRSDGVTFRVWVNGRELLAEHRADASWKPFAFDLSKLAGEIVTIRFETDPGPDNNAAFDFALWGERELVLKEFTPKAAEPTAEQPSPALAQLYSAPTGEVAPLSGFAGKISTTGDTNHATLTYRGADGTLQFDWKRPVSADDPPLGIWELKATPTGAKTAAVVPFAGDAHLQWTKPARFKASRFTPVRHGVACVSQYDVNGRVATLRCAASLRGKSLVLEVTCDTPELAAFAAGHWGPVMYREPVTVPYYSGQIFYLKRERLFVNAFLDWTKSAASSIDQTTAVYGERTDGTRVSLRERAVYCAAWNVDEVFPNIPNPPSPYRSRLASKIILDVWDGSFEGIRTNLETLRDYGLRNCAAIIHNWQRSGYDNALPAQVPANAQLGGGAGMKRLVAAAKRLGYEIALHENYVDYYPNFEGFDSNDVALNADGKPVPAWLNPGTQIQSFAVQPHAILRLARWQSSQIRDRYAPDADYLDVHSAVPPWFHVDFRAGAGEAGMFRPVWEAHRQLWSFERATYGGPVFGEGANHWFWSGLLDGVEAQFGAGWPAGEGRAAPLMVDFDLLKIHPLQFNHGMGYYERWWGTPHWGTPPPMAVLDQYRMQEIIFGHAGFLGGSVYACLPLAWLEENLVSPVAARYAAAQPVRIEYQVHGKWVDPSAAARAGIWRRARVTYDNGLTVTANDEPAAMRENGINLPQSGWLATGAGVVAWTALCQGVVADYAQTRDSTFANARPAADWNLSGVRRIQPSLTGFRQTGERAFTLSYQWQAGETLSHNYICFVHFVADDKIVLQDDHAPHTPTSTWRAGETVTDGPRTIHLPDDLPDGDYEIRMGLYLPGRGRLALTGRNDGENRIRAGTLAVRDDGRKIALKAGPADAGGSAAQYLRHLNRTGRVLDFGDVRTDGSLRVRREGDEWVLQTLPRDRECFIELQSSRFGRPETVRCEGGSAPSITPRNNGNGWILKPNGAREYRWRANPVPVSHP